jgi:hypothetical protein
VLTTHITLATRLRMCETSYQCPYIFQVSYSDKGVIWCLTQHFSAGRCEPLPSHSIKQWNAQAQVLPLLQFPFCVSLYMTSHAYTSFDPNDSYLLSKLDSDSSGPIVWNLFYTFLNISINFCISWE